MYLQSEYCVSSRDRIGLPIVIFRLIYGHIGAAKELGSNAIVRDDLRRKICSLTFLSKS